jgi:enamine deaminase RidA (YjgF/YER057c/UK114 family)
MGFKKTVIDPDIGKGFKYLKDSSIGELVHSAGVIIEAGGVKHIYCSGKTATFDQGATLEERDTVVAPGDIREQTRQILRNLQGTLTAAGATLDDIVRMRVFVKPPFTDKEFALVHEARAEVFKKEHYPASTLVIVHALARPTALLEIDCDAVIPA